MIVDGVASFRDARRPARGPAASWPSSGAAACASGPSSRDPERPSWGPERRSPDPDAPGTLPDAPAGDTDAPTRRSGAPSCNSLLVSCDSQAMSCNSQAMSCNSEGTSCASEGTSCASQGTSCASALLISNPSGRSPGTKPPRRAPGAPTYTSSGTSPAPDAPSSIPGGRSFGPCAPSCSPGGTSHEPRARCRNSEAMSCSSEPPSRSFAARSVPRGARAPRARPHRGTPRPSIQRRRDANP
jgi:hypothetical protein